MINPYIEERLAGIQNQLRAVHQAGSGLSSATKGTERAAFINTCLKGILTPQFRIGDGDITDQQGIRSGQLDVVVEYSSLPSLPVIGAGDSRLYMAEGVAAVAEVKSDLASQWGQVLETARKVNQLRRNFRNGVVHGRPRRQTIPFFAVGYAGWSTIETTQAHLSDGPIDGILIIDSGIFISASEFDGIGSIGPWSLWCFVHCINISAASLGTVGLSVPPLYGQDS